jgi:hypothetical protein
VQIIQAPADPFGLPRPVPNAQFVPLTGTFYIQLEVMGGLAGDTVDKSTINVTLQHGLRIPVNVVVNGAIQSGFTGEVTDLDAGYSYVGALVYITPTTPLASGDTYTLAVTKANSTNGLTLGGNLTSWSFSTEGNSNTKTVYTSLDLSAAPVHWNGAFYSGFARDIFAGISGSDPGSDALYSAVNSQFPKAFGLQRGNYMTGLQLSDLPRPPFKVSPDWLNYTPYAVQELETRRITAFTDGALPGTTTLTVGDFFGHGQYGIADNRPTSLDYHNGDVILVAGINSAGQFQSETTTVLTVDAYGEIWVPQLQHVASTWSPTASYRENTPLDANLPGNLPSGGCYVYKYNPAGTPQYYWGRLDAALDNIVQTYGRRMVINPTDAPGGLSNSGADDTIPKNWDELHQVFHDIASHIIQRYGATTAATFYWSIFNEPDLSQYWNAGISQPGGSPVCPPGAGSLCNWSNLQKFYDYAVDGILRAFDDNGYDSSTHTILVGGLELGAIFGVDGLSPALDIFLAHCSPTATSSQVQYLGSNAACADANLANNNLLSNRVKNLCTAHNGKGTPLDFISIHTYNRSTTAAAKMIRGKQIALSVDPTYYATLLVNTHESCPNWQVPADPAAWASYSGDGYFSSWTMDVITQLLQQAQTDPRYGFGESVMTLWPFPDSNLTGDIQSYTCNVTGPNSAITTLPDQIFNALSLVASMGNDYLVLPAATTGSHVFGGFATTTPGQAQIMLYDHNWADYESHSGYLFDVHLVLKNVPTSTLHVSQYQLDQVNNTYFQDRAAWDAPNGYYVAPAGGAYSAAQVSALQAATTLTQTGATQQYTVTRGKVTLNLPLSGNGLNYLVVTFP